MEEFAAQYGWTKDGILDLTPAVVSLFFEKAAKRKKREMAELAMAMRIAFMADGKEYGKAIDELLGREPLMLDSEKVKEFLR